MKQDALVDEVLLLRERLDLALRALDLARVCLRHRERTAHEERAYAVICRMIGDPVETFPSSEVRWQME